MIGRIRQTGSDVIRSGRVLLSIKAVAVFRHPCSGVDLSPWVAWDCHPRSQMDEGHPVERGPASAGGGLRRLRLVYAQSTRQPLLTGICLNMQRCSSKWERAWCWWSPARSVCAMVAMPQRVADRAASLASHEVKVGDKNNTE